MLLLLAASLLWAFSFGLIKGQLAGLDPVAVAAVRLFLAALLFLPLVLRGRLSSLLARRAMALGVIQFGLMYVFYIASFAWLPAWMVALFTIFTPLYVVGLDDWQRRRFTPRHLVAAVVAVAAAALVLRGYSGGADWRGVALLQGANLCFAWGQLRFVGLQKAAAGKDAALVGWMYLGAFLVTFAALLYRSGVGGILAVADWKPASHWVLLYLGLLPTGLGFYLWNRGAARASSGFLAVANNLKVPLAVAVAWIVFGESAPFVRVMMSLLVMVAALIYAAPVRDSE